MLQRAPGKISFQYKGTYSSQVVICDLYSSLAVTAGFEYAFNKHLYSNLILLKKISSYWEKKSKSMDKCDDNTFKAFQKDIFCSTNL